MFNDDENPWDNPDMLGEMLILFIGILLTGFGVYLLLFGGH